MIEKRIELTNNNKVIWRGEDKLSIEDVKEVVDDYLASPEMTRLQEYDKYYEAENTFIVDKAADKKRRDKTPNNLIPTSYFATVIDTMAGYMFSDVQYVPRTKTDEDYSVVLNDLFFNNDSDVKEMKTGIHSLAYNKGIELVYTTGDGINSPEIKFANIDPRQMILIYDNGIEPDIYCGIRITMAVDPMMYNVDVIYKDEWQSYQVDSNKKFSEREEVRQLTFSECPVVVYNSNDMSARSPYHKVIPYINALDFLITGNANDIEKLTDAILVLTKILKDEDLRHLDELKALMEIEQGERAEYLEKNSDPAFREYASKLLIQEIHKHSHVIDYYSPDSGMSGEASGKALRIRLFDMDMYSRRIEKVYKKGTEKKIRLINTLLTAIGEKVGEVDIIFNRTLPDDFEEKALVLKDLVFLSDETKIERLGIDIDKEKDRMNEQKTANAELFSLNNPIEQDDENELA